VFEGFEAFPMSDTRAADIIRRRFLASYGVALFFLVAVSLGAHVYIDRTLGVEREAARMVNLSGAQRMLSQRTLALAQSLSQEATRDPERIERLAITLNRFQAAHTELRSYALSHPMSGPLRAQFEDRFSGPDGLDSQEAAFVALAELAGERALTPAELMALEAMAYGALFAALDEAVTLFQTDAEEGLATIAAAHLIQLIVILMVLIGEALFIFWPLTRKLLAAMAVEIKARQQAEDALRVEASLDASKQRFVSLIQTDFLEPLDRVSEHLETMKGGDRAAWPGLRAQASREVDQTRKRVTAMVSFFEDWRKTVSAADEDDRDARDAA
jgi:hypothetical protein